MFTQVPICTSPRATADRMFFRLEDKDGTTLAGTIRS
jgi:hypothetical protein